jgi:hypothetical protein
MDQPHLVDLEGDYDGNVQVKNFILTKLIKFSARQAIRCR